MQTKEGVFYKKPADNPNVRYGYEYVEFGEIISLDQLRDELKVRVNFVSGGHVPPGAAKGQVRLSFQPVNVETSIVVEVPFDFGLLTDGNRGGEDPMYWRVIEFGPTIDLGSRG